jgi:hypothetical protein
MDTWKRQLPDYELRLWNFNSFDKRSSKWVSQAYDAGKYAIASDYIRLYALYNYGGIYLDTDVEVLKSFDDLLHLPYFVGEEYEEQFQHYKIESAIIGAEKGCQWIGKCASWYEDKSFILERNAYFLNPLPSVVKRTIEENYVLKWVNSPEEISRNEQEVCVLPVDYFSPKYWKTGEMVQKTDRTYTIHHFKMSWIKKRTHWEFALDTLKKIAYKIKKTIKH